MKKILALVGAVLLVASCTKDMEQRVEMATGEGAMRLGVAMQSEVTDAQELVIKIYKTDGETETLVRRYTSLNDVKEPLALLAGDYVAKVQVGQKRVVSLDEKFYYGETPFTVVAGEVEAVTVDCTMQSTVVSVQYDATVAEKLDAGFFTTIAIDDEYDAEAVKTGDVHSLTFAESGEGYVMMPEGETSLFWHFEGKHQENGDIVKEAVIADVKPATKYTIKLRFSEDAPGGIYIEATVDETVEEKDDNISFSPDPTILGVGFDMSEEQVSTGAARQYKVSALATINTIDIIADGVEFDLMNETYDGVTIVKSEGTEEYTITISEEFFLNVAGGHNVITFHIEDVDGGKLNKEVAYNVQGVMPISTTDYDLWFGNVAFKANVIDTTGTVKIAYRANGGAWTTVDATEGADGLYTATGSNFAAEKNYEYKLVVNDTDSGKILAHTTAAGAQIPNGDMEAWSTSNDVIYPYASGASPFWLTGNDGAKMANATLTKSSTDVRPGSTGQYSAHLMSQFASVMGIGKFAAGNLFVGTFSMSGLDGTVNFGRDFNFTAKPKAFTFWMKHNEGTINQNSGKPASGPDMCTANIIITSWTEPYAVNTKDQSTFFKMEDLATMDGVIGYAYHQTTTSNTEWTEYTLDIVYREDMKNVKPTMLVVSFTPSGYGDYFCGSTESWMYVDDVRLTY